MASPNYTRKTYPENQDETERVCSECKQTYPINCFWKNKTHVGGRENKCKLCSNKNQKKHRATHEYKKKDREYMREHRDKNRNKYRARWLIDYHLRHGNITKPAACAACGKKTKTTAHHNDYAQPLAVEWLCYECHRNLHAGEQWGPKEVT